MMGVATPTMRRTQQGSKRRMKSPSLSRALSTTFCSQQKRVNALTCSSPASTSTPRPMTPHSSSVVVSSETSTKLSGINLIDSESIETAFNDMQYWSTTTARRGF
uniref:Uncharacterized protein n=1 Tax=Arundo donax TaxID=35708 RepID=A0A0A9DHF5_ARUDO